MLPRVDTNIRPIASIEAPSAVASIGATKQEVTNRLDQLVIGKQIQGTILSRLSDGTFLVKLAGATARMALPQNTKVGESIPLTFVALTPRPTFLLDAGHGNTTITAVFAREDSTNDPSLSQKTNQTTFQGNAVSTDESSSYILETKQALATSILSNEAISDTAKAFLNETQDASAGSAPTNLSDTGKLINNILQHARQEGAPSTLVGKMPLLQSADELNHPEKIARQLQQIISSSGIFYESHVANWAEGKFSQTDLLDEPQAKLNLAAINLLSNSTVSDDQSKLAQIIHLQLDALDQQRVAWQGDLLPSLPFAWEISKDTQHPQAEFMEQESSWQSVVRFELPHLGVVAATINLHAGQLQLFLSSNAEDTVALLKEHASNLGDALKIAGTSLDFLNVKHDEQA